MSRASGISASVFALGVVLMLAASPTAAYNNCPNICNCLVDCSQSCGFTGPPEGETIYCGDYGLCDGGDLCTGPCTTCTSTINGTGSGDTLNGGSASECINGLGGDDTLTGNSGDDTIHGGENNDSMYGNSGNDCLYGDDGNDYADGGTGSDLCDAETEINCEL
jgi:Ca2+-binding RTX toxin-like protein